MPHDLEYQDDLQEYAIAGEEVFGGVHDGEGQARLHGMLTYRSYCLTVQNLQVKVKTK